MSAKLNPPCTKYPEDGALVGTDAIFSSKNVIPPPNIQPETPIPLPPKDDGIPAPSIYFDDRGEIHNVRIQRNDQRINILYTKKGHLRSGDMHPNEQCDFIFSGRMNVWTLSKDGSTNVQTYGKHEFVKIPRGVPHVFEFLEDSVIAEWWEPQGFQCWFYRPYREIVDASFLGLRGPSNGDAGDEDEGGDNDYEKGYHRGLVELAPVIPDKCNQSWFHAVLLVAGAAVVGLSGFSLGHASSVVKTGTVEVLCVFGGRDEMDGMVAEVDCYDPTTNSWTTPVNLPDQYLTSDCAAVTFGESQVYLMGGYDANYTALDRVTVLDMSNLSNIQITEGPILLTERGDVDAEIIGSSIYISGGFTHENDYASPHASVERLEVSVANGNFIWAEADDLGQERGDKQLVAVDGKLYALGGETKVDVAGVPEEELPSLGEKSTILDTVEVLDVSANGNEGAVWRPVNDMPAGLFRFAASAWEGSDGEPVIFVFGGQIGYNADCECFATTDKVMVLDLDHVTLGDHPQDHDHDHEDDKTNGGSVLGSFEHCLMLVISSAIMIWVL